MPAGSSVQIASTLPPAGEMGATTKTQATGLLRVSGQTDRQTDAQLTSLTRLLRKSNFMIHGGNKMMHSYDRVVKTRANPPHHYPLQRVCAARALSEALAQSRALARKSSLTDLRIACEPAASRDSGTDASQANEAVASAFTAGSVAEQQQRQHGACSPAGAEDDLSPGAVTR